MDRNADLDYDHLNLELDRIKLKVFQANEATFLSALMCTLNFSWTSDIKTACTNGISLYWNPYWFLKLPEATRITVMLHELWHVALLHMLRREGRDPKLWNYAADIVINDMLQKAGHSFAGTRPWLAPQYSGMDTETVYDHLIDLRDSLGELGTPWGEPEEEESDLDAPDGEPAEMDPATIISNVAQADMAGKASGESGVTPEVSAVLKRFLQPKLPWDTLLYDFFNEMDGVDYAWSKRNRRYREVYLPGTVEDNESLDHIIFYQDVSGSVSDGEILRMNSEVSHIWRTFSPKKMSIVLFDDSIHETYEFTEGELFEEIKVTGRGGTDLACVREHIIEHKPTAVVVFSDMCCEPMEPIPNGDDIPFLWIGVNAWGEAQIPHGRIIYMKE